MPAGQDAVGGAHRLELALGEVADLHFFCRCRIAARTVNVIDLDHGAVQADARRGRGVVELRVIGFLRAPRRWPSFPGSRRGSACAPAGARWKRCRREMKKVFFGFIVANAIAIHALARAGSSLRPPNPGKPRPTRPARRTASMPTPNSPCGKAEQFSRFHRSHLACRSGSCVLTRARPAVFFGGAESGE